MIPKITTLFRRNPTAAGAGLLSSLLLLLPLACGDDTAIGGAGGGAVTTSSVTSSTHASATNASSSHSTSGAGSTSASTGASTSASTSASTASAGGAGGAGGSGGAGGGSDAPVLGEVAVGTPLWEPVDYHQFAAPVGAMFENFSDIPAGILPPPNHQMHPDLGIGPGAAHAGPYDGELAAGVLSVGYTEHTTFTQAQGSLPNAVFSAFMLVPKAGAPAGSSPDFASGPIVPNTIFPIAVTVDGYSGGVLLPDYSYGFDVPALDDALSPPFSVDGHSHIPLFFAAVFDGLPAIPADLETRVELVDADGNGYNLTIVANAIP